MQPAQQQVGQAQQAPQEPIRRRISNFLAHTVHRFRFILLGVIIAAAAFMVGYFIWNEVNKKLVYDSTQLVEGAQDIFDKWKAEQDATKKAALAKDLGEQLSTLITRYPRQYGGQRALFLRAELEYENKAWDAAVKDYTTLADSFPASYLAAIGLFNAAVCEEEKGDRDAAEKLYLRASASNKDSPVAPRAIFNAARLAEGKEAFEEARKRYDQLASGYPQSSWTRLGKNRIIDLKVQGKIK
jgi:TolA-binding protein